MYCNRCGKEIADEAVVCIGCGCPVQPIRSGFQCLSNSEIDKWSGGAMTGLVIGSMFIPLLGIVLGIIYLSNSATSVTRKKQALTLLIVAVVVSALWFLLYIALMLFAAIVG